jgi:hypothetical protein
MSDPKTAPKTLTKVEFFAKAPTLQGMSPEAAEQTYQRWLGTGRVVETRLVTESEDGLTEDKIDVLIDIKYLGRETRRHNVNVRRREEARAAGCDVRPVASRI